MRVADLVRAMGEIAPTHLAEAWDNVGLLVGSGERALAGPVLLTIDLTERVLAEAVASKASAIVSYHPPVWEGLKRITDATPKGRIVLGAIGAGIAIYSPHTALDAIPGGITDWLCEGLSGSGTPGKIAGDCRALHPSRHQPETQQVKVVTFVPSKDADTLRQALASAGAGIIGAYRVCSFAAPGTGTFLGDETTSPAVGKPGVLKHAAELRLEMVCSKAALPLAIETLREFHPYEEPAIDVYDLMALPERHAGAGRRLVLDQPASIATLAERLKKHLGIGVVSVAEAEGRHDRMVSTIGVCPGSGASLVAAARADRCELFVTGEMKHHEMLGALEEGLGLILAGHTNTERGYLPRLASMLGARLPGLRVVVSSADRSPRVPV